jgi:putative FmdB family regulatory protein
MPLFEYICAACGEEFEKLVRKSDGNNDVTCPVCGSAEVEEIFSAFSSLLKRAGLGRTGGCKPSG